jgi:hypothetical protein
MTLLLSASPLTRRLVLMPQSEAVRDKLRAVYGCGLFSDRCHEDWLDYFDIPKERRKQRYFSVIRVQCPDEEYEAMLADNLGVENQHVLEAS